jgi:hypothetical protein
VTTFPTLFHITTGLGIFQLGLELLNFEEDLVESGSQDRPYEEPVPQKISITLKSQKDVSKIALGVILLQSIG